MSHWLPSSEPKSPFNINISSHQNVTIWKTRGRKKQIVFGLKGERLDSSPPPQHISITTRVNLLVVDYSLNKCNGLIFLLTLRLKVHIHTAIVRLCRQKNPPKNSGISFFSFYPIHAKISTENRAERWEAAGLFGNVVWSDGLDSFGLVAVSKRGWKCSWTNTEKPTHDAQSQTFFLLVCNPVLHDGPENLTLHKSIITIELF